jgi:hypothetical protein
VVLAQQDLSARLRPIAAPIRRAGTYHVATGTWTRGAALESAVGPSVVYDNTCAPVYWVSQYRLPAGPMRFQHRSRVPSPTGPSTPSIAYATGYDEAPGCATSYLVDGFEIAYCSSATHPFDYRLEFANSYTSCGAASMVADEVFDLIALPGGTASGAQHCWIVDVDLQGSGRTFVLTADGDGTYAGPSTVEQFGCAWTMVDPTITSADFTGPIIAGDFTWTGAAFTGPLAPCRGTDGTIWQSPVNPSAPGTGMASNNYFRLDPPNPEQNCYFFSGNPHADFFLKLFSSDTCPPSPMIPYCTPGEGGVRECPCGNPPSGAHRGCDNSAGTGGAALTASGAASLANDTLVFATSGERPTALSVVFQGTSSLNQGVVSGQGIRCIAGRLKRLYSKNASGGSITAPSGSEPSVSIRSAALGDVITPGERRLYAVVYRDPAVLGGCPAGSTFDTTQAGDVYWFP